MLRWWPREAAEPPMDLRDTQFVTESVLGDPAVSRGLGWMFSRVPFQPHLLLSVILGMTDPPELNHKNKKLLFISPGSLLQDLYSNLKVSSGLYLKTT